MTTKSSPKSREIGADVLKRCADLYREGKTYAEIKAAVKSEHNQTISDAVITKARDTFKIEPRHCFTNKKGNHRQATVAVEHGGAVTMLPASIEPFIAAAVAHLCDALTDLPVRLSTVLIDVRQRTYICALSVEVHGKLDE